MKVEILQQVSGKSPLNVGDKIDLDDATAIRFIKKGIAKARSQKAHNELVARVEKAQEAEAEKEAKVTAIRQEAELKAKANNLLFELIETVEIISTMNEEYRDEFLAKFHEAFVDDTDAEAKKDEDI